MNKSAVFIAEAIERIQLIKSYIDGYRFEDFLTDRKTQDAVIRNLEVIGQALKDFSVEDLSKIKPDTPWQRIAGMRNVLAHEYLGVDLSLVWETVNSDMEPLRHALQDIQRLLQQSNGE